MIITVTPNGSLDLTLERVGAPAGDEQSVRLLAETAGGKGHNVARFLVAAGHDVTALGFAGGQVGLRLAAMLREGGVPTDLTPIDGQTRQDVTILGTSPVRRSYVMTGPTVTADDCGRLTAAVRAAAPGVRFVVLAGSLPPGSPVGLYADIINAVRPTPVILDSSGDALVAGVEAGPWMIKINRDELGVFEPRLPAADAPAAAWSRSLAALAARTAVTCWWVTLGEAGSVGWVEGEVIRTPGPRIEVVNTLGAGDAFLAGLLHAHLRNASLREAAVEANAWAGAACELPAPTPPDPTRIAALVQQIAAQGAG